MQCLQLDKEVHHVTDLPLTNYVRREFPEHDLMTYRHKETEVWVLGMWVDKVQGVIREILIIGQSPAEFTREKVVQLDRMLCSTEGSDAIRRIARAKGTEFVENQLESQDTWDRQKASLRKRLPGLQGQHPCLQGPR